MDALYWIGTAVFFAAAVGRFKAKKNRVYVKGWFLCGPGKTRYRLTQEDKLWLGRAVYGESGSHSQGIDAVIWALAQNFMLVKNGDGRRPRFATFTHLIRAYSQPVNRDWADPNSEKCQRHPAACTQSRLDRRKRIQSMDWPDLPFAVRRKVAEFFSGNLLNPVPGMVDFAAYKFKGDKVNIAGNWFGTQPWRNIK